MVWELMAFWCLFFKIELELKHFLMNKSGRSFKQGGSYPAGAFISPKIGKNSPLLELTQRLLSSLKIFILKTFQKSILKVD